MQCRYHEAVGDAPVLGDVDAPLLGCIIQWQAAGRPSLSCDSIVSAHALVGEPPLRIVLEGDVYELAEKSDLAKIALGKKWKGLS